MVANLVELAQGVFAFVEPDPALRPLQRRPGHRRRRSDGHRHHGNPAAGRGRPSPDHRADGPAGAADQAGRADVEPDRLLRRGATPSGRAAFYGTELTSDQLDAPPNPDAFRRLLPDFATAYDDRFTNPAGDPHGVSEGAWLSAAGYALPLAGESPANLVLRVEGGRGWCSPGALASFGGDPAGLRRRSGGLDRVARAAHDPRSRR